MYFPKGKRKKQRQELPNEIQALTGNRRFYFAMVMEVYISCSLRTRFCIQRSARLFHYDAIFSVFLIFLVSATETLGDTSALAAMGFNREAKDREISGSIAVDGFVSAVSSLFGCLPITSFSQNVGLIAMTHVVNRKAIASGAVIMVLAGLIPALGVILASLPEAVLGGCTLMMFGSIVMSGVQMISRCGYSQRNMSIAALSLSIGLGFTQTPQIFRIFPELLRSVFAENCVAVVFIVAVLLNLVFPKGEEEKAAAGAAE